MSSASTEPTGNLRGERTTLLRRVPRTPGEQLDLRLGQPPLTEAEALLEDRFLAAELEETGRLAPS